MPRLLTRAVRLLKFGAVAGAAVGVGRLVMNRRRRTAEAESSWPTIAETAAQNGESLDDDADASEPPAADASADNGQGANSGDDDTDKA